ncbi:MAG TPA: N-acetylglucosamine-6-phosphate deacetylase [Alphaproteobacteria bacterium]|nr:N-acetylglucosamine-6-phosphate deacetylase [Alphaproteobacteria bacterium]
MATAYCDATIFTGETWVEGHALLVEGGKILDIAAQNRIPGDAKRAAYKGQILAPGFIDAQVNGGGNVLLNNTPTADACIAIAKAHQKHGTTRLLPTCISDTPEITGKALAATRTAHKSCPNILGIHIEGPHLGQERRGVHKSEYLRSLSADDLKLYQPESGEVILTTVAPETVSPDDIKKLKQQGAIISLGHTSASPDKIKAALAAGATGFTHLFNGMGKPGENAPADTAVRDQDSWCGIIIDGFHVTPEMLQLALRSKPKGKVFLVSDAMPPAASDNPQPFQLYGETIRVENGRCVNHEGKLAGSSITMADAVRNCVKSFGVEMEEALRMASAYPAAFLGLDQRFGKLLPGFDADIVAMTPEIEIRSVIVAGREG